MDSENDVFQWLEDSSRFKAHDNVEQIENDLRLGLEKSQRLPRMERIVSNVRSRDEFTD